MRHLLYLTAFAVLVTLNGCRSCTTMPSPIVGDSMCHWGATTNSSQPCQPQTINFRGALAKFLGGCGTCGPACSAADKYNDFSNEPCGGCGCQSDCSCGMAAGCGTGACGSGSIIAMPGPVPFSYSGGMSNSMPMGVARPMAMSPSGMGSPVLGCGGATCAGICGGRCEVAHNMAAAAAAHAHGVAMRVPAVANMVEKAHRSCAYGACGARPGPQQGAVSFPYYTVRGPRDFLAAEPPSIGP